MKLLGSTEKRIVRDKYGERVFHLEITEKYYSPSSFIFLKPFNSDFSYIELWFIDLNSKPLDIAVSINELYSVNNIAILNMRLTSSLVKRYLIA